jgi:hypothetical protein
MAGVSLAAKLSRAIGVSLSAVFAVKLSFAEGVEGTVSSLSGRDGATVLADNPLRGVPSIGQNVNLSANSSWHIEHCFIFILSTAGVDKLLLSLPLGRFFNS